MGEKLNLGDPQVQRAIKLNKDAARKGKNSLFRNWWFFDTNCISELIKLSLSGFNKAVCEFINNKDILISASVIQELRKRPDLLLDLDDTLSCSNLFLVPDNTRFWYTDIFNFLNVLDLKMNSLQVYPLLDGFARQLIISQEFEEVCKNAEANVNNLFLSKVVPDVGANLDERDLSAIIWQTVNRYGNEWFKINIPPADCNSLNFPSFYVYYYTYYYRYIKNSTVKPELNDFIDLANCLVAPYCEKYFAENKFTNVLRLSVKGRTPPTAYQMIKRAFKKGLIDNKTFQNAKIKKDDLSVSDELLKDTKFYKYSEMVDQIKGIKQPNVIRVSN